MPTIRTSHAKRFDIKTNSEITPYIGGGLGVANVAIDNLSLSMNGVTILGSEDDTVFAYQVGLGIGYEINDEMTADFGYRYFAGYSCGRLHMN